MSNMKQPIAPNALQLLYVERLANKLQNIANQWQHLFTASKQAANNIIESISNQVQQMVTASQTIGLSTICDLTKELHSLIIVVNQQQCSPNKKQDNNFHHKIATLGDVIESQILALKALLSHDPTTGLPNRTTILERLDIELARASRQGTQLCFCLVQLDKTNNATQPTAAFTQQAIKILTAAMQQRLRKSDIMGSFTNTTLAIIFPDTELADARPLLHTTQQNFANIAIDNHTTSISIAIAQQTEFSNAVTISAVVRKLIAQNKSDNSFLTYE